MKALIDGDIIQYRCGFASDKLEYVVDDKAGGAVFKYKKEANEFCDKVGLDKKTDITKREGFEPVEHCLHSVKLTLKGILEATDATEHQIFLTGKANFRDDLYKKYKANRDRTRKPHWFNEIGEYLKTVWKAEEVTGVEADDAMGWWQYKEILNTKGSLYDSETVICTLDKDLNMIPGWHYNWVADGGKGTMYCTTPEESILYFAQQWLTGDPADNIPGLPKVGEKTAQKILGHLNSSNLSARSVYNEIEKQYTQRGFTHEMMHLIGDLLWIQRNPGQTWDQYLGLSKLRKEKENG